MASTTLASEIVDEAELILQDTTNVRWAATEHLQALNNGMKAISSFKPDAYVTTESVTLKAGVYQALPSGAFQLINIFCNQGVAPGATPGKVIRLIEERILDAMNPNWHSATASATVDYYMYDEKVPLSFMVSPPQPASGFGYAQMAYAKVPTEIAIDAVILVSDIYKSPLLKYVLAQAYLKESDFLSSGDKAIAYYNAFLSELGQRQLAKQRDNVNRKF